MITSLRRRYVDPYIIPIGVVLVLVVVIITIGESLLASVTEGDTKDRLDRPELWLAIILTAACVLGGGFLASRPQDQLKFLSKSVVLPPNDRKFFDPERPPLDETLRAGERGTVSDIAQGYTLYSQSGPLATVLGTTPGGRDFGKSFAGFIYATGLYGASKEMWIPFEAVISVYPETSAAFLSIKGDETEHFGWHIPPENLRRGEAPRTNELG